MKSGISLEFARLKGFVLPSLCLLSTIISVPAWASVVDRPYLRANAIVIVFGADGFSEEGGQGGIVVDFLLLDSASGTAATDLIAADGVTTNVNTQQFNPIQNGEDSGIEFDIVDPTFGGSFNSVVPNQTLDAADSYTAFGLDGDTNIELLNNGNRASRFFVASNAAFDVYGQVTDMQTSGDFSALDLSNIQYRLRVQPTGGGGPIRWGVNAQDPSVGGGGVVVGGTGSETLQALDGQPVKVFDGGRRTAARNGSILSQSVGFQSRYGLLQQGSLISAYDFSQGTGTISADVTYTIFTP
ncbi:MAG: hypothetical protein ABJG88_07285 [Litorimonas sp.]